MPLIKLKLGQRLVVIAEIDLGPYGLVVVGDMGTVVYRTDDETQISIDRFIPTLCDWENGFTITDDESCDSVRASLRTIGQRKPIDARSVGAIDDGGGLLSRCA